MRVVQVHWFLHLTGHKFDNEALFSHQVGPGGQSCAYVSCSVSIGLSFEPLTAIVRSKLDSVGHVAYCSGGLASATDGA